MSNFKVGDRVRIRSWESMKKEFGLDEDGDIKTLNNFVRKMKHLCGRTATIKSIVGKSVELKNWSDDSGDTGWGFSTDMLEPANEFEAGQIYRVGFGGAQYGSVIRIVDACCGSNQYKVIRGPKEYSKLFDDGSPFAGSLTLLTGPQIGEAIRKWDEEHAKKSGVREVKRHAKSGEYIKIVTSFLPIGYKDGDILLVTKGFNDTSVICQGAKICVCDSEYVVLEGYKPEKEEHRKAKVGDTVKVLHDNGGRVEAGTVWKVKSVNPSGDLSIVSDTIGAGMAWMCREGNYIVLSFGRHAYTESKIAEAKKLCGEMMVEAFDDGNTFAFHFYDKFNGGYKGDCAENECKFETAAFDGTKKCGIATCSDHDEYNVWIGRCVALCKALHKPIPAFIMGDGATSHFDFEKARSKGSNAGYVSIHCAGEKETRELMKELDALGYKWESGNTLPSLYYGDGYFHVKSTKSVVRSDCSTTGDNYVEFSDCFTEG